MAWVSGHNRYASIASTASSDWLPDKNSPSSNDTLYRIALAKATGRTPIRVLLSLLGLTTVLTASLGLGFGVSSRSWRQGHQTLVLDRHRPESSVDETLRYRTARGGNLALYNVSWMNDDQEPRHLELCLIENICVPDRTRGRQNNTYYLLANRNEADLTGRRDDAVAAFRTCMHRYGNQHDRTLGLTNLRSHKGEVRWVNGSTFGFLKDEPDNHPAAWTRIWSTFLSASIRAWPVLRKAGVRSNHFFDQYQLFEQSYELNGWQQFIMEVATTAAVKTLPDAQFGASFHPQVIPHSSGQQKWQASPQWMDESRFTSQKGGLTCYEKMIVVPNDRQYFQDRNDAQYFRNEALQRLNIPQYRQTPCKRTAFRVLLLQRDRPLWNEAAVIKAMKDSGAANIVIDGVDERVPYYNQIELFYKADIIVSVHGSHLQNQHFMQPHAHIIEIFPKNYYHSEQLHLAHWTSVNIAQLINSTFPSEKTVDARKDLHLSKAYHKCLKQFEVYPDAEQCMAHKRCYDPCRSLGAQANMGEFKIAFEHAVSALMHAPHCR